MKTTEQCPKGCGETMVRHDSAITIQYGSAHGWGSQPQTHMAWYACTNCHHTYVSSVFKRFRERNIR